VQIQLKGNDNSSGRNIVCALTASTCGTPSPLDKHMRASDAVCLVTVYVKLFSYIIHIHLHYLFCLSICLQVSRGTDNASTTKVFASKKCK
jgi:hypothetical protein